MSAPQPTVQFTTQLLRLASGKSLHVSTFSPTSTASRLPIIFLHGLGGSSAYWAPSITASGIAEKGAAIAYDFDGHGRSPLSAKDGLSVDTLVEDLRGVVEALKFEKVGLAGHSMSGLVVSTFAEHYPEKVEKIFLLHPVRSLSAQGREGMHARASTVLTPSGPAQIASTVASSALSASVRTSNPLAIEYVRHLVLNTLPEGYAAACRALGDSKDPDLTKIQAPALLVGGEEDYLAGPEVIKKWGEEIKESRVEILKDVGHWGGVEAPEKVGKLLEEWFQ